VDGLQVSLGIERLVSINGEVMARTRINISDLNHLNEAQLRQTGDALSSVKLIQNGSENIYQAGSTIHGAGGTVSQNTLNDQLIRSQTVISSTVNSATLLKTQFSGQPERCVDAPPAPLTSMTVNRCGEACSSICSGFAAPIGGAVAGALVARPPIRPTRIWKRN
jgi:hypothetical protein